jgi:hypothetical protein
MTKEAEIDVTGIAVAHSVPCNWVSTGCRIGNVFTSIIIVNIHIELSFWLLAILPSDYPSGFFELAFWLKVVFIEMSLFESSC